MKGFGLGLYYVRQICEAHRWDIRVESEPGRGTTFYLRFPLVATPETVAA